MATRNYSSIHKIKDFAINELAPRYFNMEEVNDLNIGLLGYTTELLGTIGEDSFNTISTYLNEIFPNLAVIPESIFNYGALFKIDGIFATASQCDMLLFIPEEYVTKYAVYNSYANLYEFYLDNNMTIYVEDIPFKPDYSIKINYKLYNNDRIYTAMYDKIENNSVYNNTISDIINPYIKLKRVNVENNKYLQLEVRTHQVEKFTMNDNVVDTTIINLPKYTLEYDNYIANFEVFYREAGSTTYTQLDKLALGSAPIKAPFCYYKAIDENKIEISFSSRDNYFYPKYNSEINISYYTTTGDAGNFEQYIGDNIQVITNSEVYDYNNHITLFAIPMTGSHSGKQPLDINEMKNMIIEMFSTVASYTNENDLQLYFDNFNRNFNSNVLFLKKRDDIFERLFNAFVLLKDSNNEIYSTNTLKLDLNVNDFDIELAQSNIYIMKPGHIFKYKPNTTNVVERIDNDIMAISSDNEEFLYSNPFLIYFSKSPSDVGYYLTTIESKHVVDYKYVNDTSLVQFICNSLSITRDGISGSDSYTVKLTVSPTTDLDNPMIIEERDPITNDIINTVITESIQVKLIATSGSMDSPICYTNMKLESWDTKLDVYTFSCEIKTDDYILSNNRFRILDMIDITSNEVTGQHLIPMTDCVLEIDIGYKYADNNTTLIHTNTYTTETNPVTFIKPIKMMRSTTQYIYNNDGIIEGNGAVIGGTYNILMDSVPLVSTSTLQDINVYKEFYNTFTTQYNYINDILNLITNNYAIDIKFYNTYGKSKNFITDQDTNNVLNKVNISIGFKIHTIFGVDVLELEKDIKIFIKEYIENINDSGSNTFYVSNLIRALENNFSSIEYLKFTGINDYSTDVQAIINITKDLNVLTKEERICYIPEYLTLKLEDISIQIV